MSMSPMRPVRMRPRSQTALRVLLASLLAVVPLALVASPAHAVVGLTITGTVPSAVTVGQTGLAASLTVTNTSTAGEEVSIGPQTLKLTPACGVQFPVDCLPGQVDPGVFTIHSAVGRVGSGCAGEAFTVEVDDVASGRVRFEPGTGTISLPAGSACIIDYQMDVLAVPAHDAQPITPGIQTLAIRLAAYDAGVPLVASSTSVITVSPLPTISTQSSGTVKYGDDSSSDTVTVSGRVNPSASARVGFRLYGPDDATCSSSTPAWAAEMFYPVTGGPVTTPKMDLIEPLEPGTYRWIARYFDDPNNPDLTGACNDPNESFVVTKATPTIPTTASAGFVLGQGSMTDTATVTGRVGPNAGATVQFRLYGPGDGTCTGTPVFQATVAQPVANGPVTSPPYTPTTAGTYRWVATYSGDAHNAAVSGSCGDVTEHVVVSKLTPTLSTTASPSVLVGGSLTDTATVSGGQAPTGTITFTLFGPQDEHCLGTPLLTSVKALDGATTSTAYTATEAGTYRWRAAYSGDANNHPVVAACNAPGEHTLVTAVTAGVLSASQTALLADTGTNAGGMTGLALALLLLGASLAATGRRLGSRH